MPPVGFLPVRLQGFYGPNHESLRITETWKLKNFQIMKALKLPND